MRFGRWLAVANGDRLGVVRTLCVADVLTCIKTANTPLSFYWQRYKCSYALTSSQRPDMSQVR